MRARIAFSLLAACGGLTLAQTTEVAPEVAPALVFPHMQDLAIDGIPITNLRVIARPSDAQPNGGFEPRDGCPETSSYTNASFSGGTYTAQGGFAQQEIAAVSYTLPANNFPLRIVLLEAIFAQLNAVETTTTEWTALVWNGIPTSVQPAGFPYTISSDGETIPHLVMGPGTRGTNIQASIDPNDPEQIYIYAPLGATTHTFTIGYRIDRHNSQTSNPCTVAPPSSRNAFPCTDNTVIGCNSGYGALSQPNNNWLFAVNCGANGCPPNGGWARFSGLQADQNFFGLCFTGCRPRGDWVMRATWDPVTCPPPDGACCFGTAGCFITDGASCVASGGTFQGGGTSCGERINNQWTGCQVAPNADPVANAGPDQTVADSNNNGSEIIVVNGSGSTDSDGNIQTYRWTRGLTVLQDGPAFLSVALPVGVHTLTLTVTDDRGGSDQDQVVVTITGGGQQCPWSGGCAADFDADQDFDSDDISLFFGEWDQGNTCGDADSDGDTDSDDITVFFNAWDSGSC